MNRNIYRFSVQRHLTIGIIALLVLVGGFEGWAALSQISGAIVASGQIEVDQNRQVVQHPDGGVIAEFLIEEGDVVIIGQPLLRLDPTLELSELSIIEDQLYELFARRGRLEAERDGTQDISFEPELIKAAQRDAQSKSCWRDRSGCLTHAAPQSPIRLSNSASAKRKFAIKSKVCAPNRRP